MKNNNGFAHEAERILALKVESRVNSLGGYGKDGEVIYEKHPIGCPSTLVTSFPGSKATFMTNGSVSFEVKIKEGMDVNVLLGSFDSNEKHETNSPSCNVWISGDGFAASLINPGCALNCEPVSMKIVKLGDPGRAMWFTYSFAPLAGVSFETALKLSFIDSKKGPALLRQVYMKNTGRKALKGNLWAYFNLQGMQKFIYNKPLWYDSGLPLTPGEMVASCPVPYTEIAQIKRISGISEGGIKLSEATCDYTSFVGDISGFALMPQAVKIGKFMPGAGKRLNRFSVPTVSAVRSAVDIAPGKTGVLKQSLQYMTDGAVVSAFRKSSACSYPGYLKVEKAFLNASKALIKNSPSCAELILESFGKGLQVFGPAFSIEMPKSRVVTEYAKSVWTGVQELYENCRAHGSMLADGIELGTRDRGQDMWPKMKEDAKRVREDLIHALSFMYMTVPEGHRFNSPMSRAEKLHGMFPRQFPSKWLDRFKAVMNDNRPYNDSAIWLINSLQKYLCETGDLSILAVKVKSVTLTKPETPEQSGITGCEREFSIAEIMVRILECYARHAKDSPFGMVQIMYGDWCDPVDMMGTSIVGDALTRGKGRGVSVRLSAQVVNSMIDTIDLFNTAGVLKLTGGSLNKRIDELKADAARLRGNIINNAWEDDAFLDAIHEQGYTIGSMKGRDFDGINRRELLTQAHCIPMLLKERTYLPVLGNAGEMLKALLATVDRVMYDKELGLMLFNPPISNDDNARKKVGRMGIVPAGTAENGEYHHAQLMMHVFRIQVNGEADTAWKQFKAVISATKDETLGGPFEMPSTSYASDREDPHYGKGMYFGLSGSTDWIVEFMQEIAGVKLALHDQTQPAISVSPRMPAELKGALKFKRLIHFAGKNGFVKIPFELEIDSRSGKTDKVAWITVNGKPSKAAEVADLSGLKQIKIIINYL